MSLSKIELARQNQANAQHSTGPKTDEGKKISSRNSFVYGLTSHALTLPHENPTDIQARLDAWTESFQPQGHHEQELVGQIALASIRLGRLARAETEFVAEQTCMAQFDWDRVQETRLLEAKRLQRIDPAMALIKLKSFASGVEWMIERWTALKECLEASKRWNNVALIHEAIRLEGTDPTQIAYAHISVYEIAALACACTKGYDKDPGLMSIVNQAPAEWIGRGQRLDCPPEVALPLVMDHVNARIEELTILAKILDRCDDVSHNGSIPRAGVPDDTSSGRLLLRYRRAAESSMEKSIKALQKLQAERRKAAEKQNEAKRSASREKLRNEPNSGLKPPQGHVQHGSCVRLNEVDYEVLDRGEGTFWLCPMTSDPISSALEVAATPLRLV